MLKSLLFLRSNGNWRKRRQYMMAKIGIKQMSKKIPLIIKALDEQLQGIKAGDRVELSSLLEEASMTIITKTIFGEDADD